MAGLLFDGNTTDLVNCGSNAILDDVLQGSYLVWGTLTTLAAGLACSKGTGNGNGFRNFAIISNTSFTMTVDRATDLAATALATNFAHYPGLNQPFCYAGTFDTAGANGDQKLYIGNPQAPLAEPSAYSAQTVGSGAPPSNAAVPQYIGNNATPSNGWDGIIFAIQMWNKVLTRAQLIDVQSMPVFGPKFGPIACWTLGTPGQGTSLVKDLSGNGNHGAITGATQTGEPMPYLIPSPILVAPAVTLAGTRQFVSA